MSQMPEDDFTEPQEEARPSAAPRNPLLIAWQRKPLVALGLVIGVAAGALFAARQPPVYQATAQVLVVKKYADAAIPLPSGTDPRMNYYEDYVSTHLALIKSRVVVEKAVKKRNLQDLPSFAGKGNPTGTIIASLSATRDLKDSGATNIMYVTFKGPDAEDCQTVIDAVIESYKDFLDETYHNVSDDTVKLITQARDLIEKDLAEKEKEYSAFREKAPLAPVQTKDGSAPTQVRLGELAEKRLSLLMRGAELEEQLKALEKAKKEGKARELVEALSTAPGEKPQEDTNLEGQLLALLQEEQGLMRVYGEDHPEVQAVRKRIEMTREFLSPEKKQARLGVGKAAPDEDPVETFSRNLRQQLASVKLTQQSLVGLTADEEKDARELARYEIQDASFRADIARTQQIYDQTISRLKEINLVRDFGGYDAKVISPAGAGGRIGTGFAQIVLAGVALGLLLGVGLAYLADMTDRSFRSPEEIRRRLGLPVVAHVPIIEEHGPPDDLAELPLDRALAIYHRPKSGEAEAYRSLRTALYFTTHGETNKVIQISSPNKGDGKSTIAANLAIAIAQSGKRVILVDGDMRRPRVHTLFGIKPDVGLGQVIMGEATVADAVVPGGIDNLSLLTCGPRPENPAELLTQPRFELVLAELRQQYEYVIVDTPPLLAVTDPAVVVSRMDAVFLVVRLSRNGRPAAERSREILRQLRANVLGVVVNGVGKVMGAYGYQNYTYEYGYGGAYAASTPEANGHSGTNLGAQKATGTATQRRSRRGKRRGWFRRMFS
jgi:capsular exopolysaccharide synthesis family protein